MQGAGLCNNVTDVDAIAWNADIRPVLTHWISCIHVSKTCLSRMETLQAKLLKQELPYTNGRDVLLS